VWRDIGALGGPNKAEEGMSMCSGELSAHQRALTAIHVDANG